MRLGCFDLSKTGVVDCRHSNFRHNIAAADSDRNIAANLVVIDRIANLRCSRYSWIYLLS